VPTAGGYPPASAIEKELATGRGFDFFSPAVFAFAHLA